MTFPETITVTIPPQKFDIEKYTDQSNCYLAEALKKLGYPEDLKVATFGCTFMPDEKNRTITYRPVGGNFDSIKLNDAFERNQNFVVVLEKVVPKAQRWKRTAI